MLYNPYKGAVDLRVLIDKELFKMDENDVPKIFKSAWNEAVAHTYPAPAFEGEVVMDARMDADGL